MLSLKNKVEFDFVYQHGKRYFGKGINLYLYHPSLLPKKALNYKERKVFASFKSLQDEFSLGLSVSKKIGNAPTRNLIKRRMRSFCRHHASDLAGCALIFVAKETLAYKTLCDEALMALRKISRRGN